MTVRPLNFVVDTISENKVRIMLRRGQWQVPSNMDIVNWFYIFFEDEIVMLFATATVVTIAFILACLSFMIVDYVIF